jgi:hypothetical protein
MKTSASKTKAKCPECAGTGTQKQKSSGAPKIKCTECGGDGIAKDFQMIFWHYDKFPYVLSNRGFMCTDGTAYVPSYNSYFRPCKVMSLMDGLQVEAKLKALETERREILESLEKGYRLRLGQLAPWTLEP